MRCGCRPWCCREMRCSGKMRWRCGVRRSSEMRHCGRMRLRPEGWMGRHHQMPRGRRRPGDVRPDSGARRSRPNHMAHRCRPLFKLQPRRLMRRDGRRRPCEVRISIERSTRFGYGIVATDNSSSIICQTANDDHPKAHDALINRWLDRLEYEFQSRPVVAVTSIESAFVG